MRFRLLALLAPAWALAVGTGLLWLWPLARGHLKGTWLNDLWIPAIPVYVVLGLWIAERIWAMIPARGAGSGSGS